MQREIASPTSKGSTDNEGIVAMGDDGTVRWSVPRGYARAVDEEVWYVEEGELVSVGVLDGVERWRVDSDLGGPRRLFSNEVTGLAHDRSRGVPLVVAHRQLVAYR